MEPFIRASGVVFGTLRAEYRQLANRYFGKLPRFSGNATDVCEQVVETLWEGDFYRTSLGHFDFFWMRDFGTVCESLVKLGHTARVHHTLHWAMIHYRRSGHVTLCIDKSGHCFNAPGKSIDALPWLLHCLVVSEYELNKADRLFLNRALRDYSATYLDTHGYIKEHSKYAEMRDAVIYDRSAYSVALLARLTACAELLNLSWPYKKEQYEHHLLHHYWNGHYFNADYKNDAFSAECALFPFFLNIIKDKHMVEQTVAYIQKQHLSDPYPLIYTNTPERFRYHWWMTKPWMPDYQGATIWSWHGEYYLHLLHRYKHPSYAKEYAKFSKMIEQHGMFPEMLNLDGSWYYAPIYRGDPGMVWAALYLELPVPRK